MAEEKKNNNKEDSDISLKKSITVSPGKGMFTDASPETQPERTYKFALNAISESDDGDQGFLISEAGNYECSNLEADIWIVVGHIYMDNDSAIVFLAGNNPDLVGWGRIIQIDKNCNEQVILTSSCLNFSPDHPIQGIYRIRRGCERTIYFTDNNNSVRVLNLDSLRDYLDDDHLDHISNTEAGPNPNDWHFHEWIWDCEKMGMFPTFSVPDIGIESIVDGGGALKLGAYQFCVAYQDEDLNSTNFFDISKPIPISADPIGSPVQEPDAYDIQGGDNVIFAPTNKTINLQFNYVDTSYAFLRLVCIPSTSGTGTIDGDVWEIASIPITDENFTFPFTGWDEVLTPKLGLDEILIPSLSFERAKTLEQIDNRLVLGNVSNSILNWAPFQHAATAINVKYRTQGLYAYSTHHGGPLSYRYYNNYRSFMRDEVYALGIVWIFRNGKESPVFHIPGRAPDTSPFGNAFAFNGVDGADPNNPMSQDAGAAAASHYTSWVRAEHNRAPIRNSGLQLAGQSFPGGGWDTDIVTTSGDLTNGFINQRAMDCNTEHLVGYSSDPVANGTTEDFCTRRWNVYNTAIRTAYYWIDEDGNRSTQQQDSRELVTEGYMGYYECKDFEYPDKKDCNGDRVFPEGKIRHHRMPDTTLEPHFYGDPDHRVTRGSTYGMTCVNTNPYSSDNPWEGGGLISGQGGSHANQSGGLGDDIMGPDIGSKGHSASYLCDRIVSLGVKFLNIQIPSGYEDRLQGFRIVRALRGEKDKSVLDKGIMFYNQYSSLSGNCDEITGVENIGNNVNGFQPAASSHTSWQQVGGLSKGFRHGENTGSGNNNDWRECVDDATTTLLRPIGGWSSHCGANDPDNRCMPFWLENDCGPDHSCTHGIGGPFSEYGPFVGYPYMNLETHYVTGGDEQNYWSKKAFAGGNFNLSYHGPLAKFSTNNIRAEFLKVERVLAGRVRVRKDDTHANCGDCDDRPANWMYWMCQYDHSFVPYYDQGQLFESNDAHLSGTPSCGGEWGCLMGEYNDQPLVNRTIVAQSYVGKGGSIAGLFSNDTFRNGYAQNETYVIEVMNSVYDFQHYAAVDTNLQNWGFKTGIPFPYYGRISLGGGRGQPDQGAANTPPSRFISPPADSSCFQVADENNPSEYDRGYGGSGKIQSTGYYVSLKKNAPNAFSELTGLRYVSASNRIHRLGKDYPAPGLVDDTSDTSYYIFGGDSFISKFAFRKCNHNKLCYNCDGGAKTSSMFLNTIVWYWLESYINCEYRHSLGNAGGTGSNIYYDSSYSSHYPYWSEGNINDGLGLFNGGFLDSENRFEVSGWSANKTHTFHNNIYNINPDYLKDSKEKIYRPLPLTYDYCGVCSETFTDRIVYSQQSFKEEIADNYRIFFTDNYSDIPGHRGPITNLWVLGSTIYAHTEESLWRLHAARQEVKTDNKSLRIGTGDFLAEPPQEMAEAEFGYLGSQSQWATIVTENGTFFPDARQGRVYLITGEKRQDLSNMGMRNFFEENSEMLIEKQYKQITGEEFPLKDKPHHPHGSGFIATYDSRHTRYILTKRDYKVLDEDALLNGYRYKHADPEIHALYDSNEPALYFSVIGEDGRGYTQWKYRTSGGSSPFYEGTEDHSMYFRDWSWTISFNSSAGNWSSFHSYKPNVFITLKNSFLSSYGRFYPSYSIAHNYHKYLYKHGSNPDHDNYGIYYGTIRPFIVDFIATQNAIQTFEYNNIHFITHASTYNAQDRSYVDKRSVTFNHAILYNSYQCSSKLQLAYKELNPSNALIASTSDFSSAGIINLTRKERTWSFNDFRDAVSNRDLPMFTSDWFASGFIPAHEDGEHRIINPGSVQGQQWFDTQRFRDKYLGIRFYFRNFATPVSLSPSVMVDNCKLIFNYLYTQQTFSAR